jgi:hypothetical protein
MLLGQLSPPLASSQTPKLRFNDSDESKRTVFSASGPQLKNNTKQTTLTVFLFCPIGGVVEKFMYSIRMEALHDA